MTDVNSVIDDVKNIIVDHLGVERSIIELSSTLLDLGADELDVVELVMAFEEEYSIDLSKEDFDYDTKVEEIVKAISNHIPISLNDIQQVLNNETVLSLVEKGMGVRKRKDEILNCIDTICGKSQEIHETFLNIKEFKTGEKCWIVESNNGSFTLRPGLRKFGAVIGAWNRTTYYNSETIPWADGPCDKVSIENIEEKLSIEVKRVEEAIRNLKSFIGEL